MSKADRKREQRDTAPQPEPEPEAETPTAEETAPQPEPPRSAAGKFLVTGPGSIIKGGKLRGPGSVIELNAADALTFADRVTRV